MTYSDAVKRLFTLVLSEHWGEKGFYIFIRVWSKFFLILKTNPSTVYVNVAFFAKMLEFEPELCQNIWKVINPIAVNQFRACSVSYTVLECKYLVNVLQYIMFVFWLKCTIHGFEIIIFFGKNTNIMSCKTLTRYLHCALLQWYAKQIKYFTVK